MTKKITPNQIIEAEQLLTVLKEKFPNTFFSDPVDIRPLKINIHRDIHAHVINDYSKKQVCRALHLYINQADYRNKLIIDAQRIDLNGNVCGTVTEEHITIGEEVKQRQQRRQARLQAEQTKQEKTATSSQSTMSLLGRPILSLKRANGQNGVVHNETHTKENTMDHTTEQKPHSTYTPSVSGSLEVNIKIHSLPTDIQTVKNGWLQFMMEADGQIVLIKVRPKIWKKMQHASENYEAWVASITGKIGRRIKNGFELLQPAVQIFEKKARDELN